MKIERPRLRGHVFPRRHRIDGVERIALHDSERGSLALIEPSDWSVVATADGTRTLPEILARASSVGDTRIEAEVSRLFDELFELGLLSDGPSVAEPVGLPDPTTSEERSRRPLEALPGFALSCDGRGGCCAQYSSIVLTPDDLTRAREVGLRSLESGAFSGDPLLPFSGVRSEKRALPIIDGACAELTDDGHCSLHARGGPTAKPIACLSFPRTFVDDGEAVRVSIACECACVFRSVGLSTDQGDPLVAEGALDARALPDGLSVRVLPAFVVVTSGVFAARSEVVAWSKRALSEDPPEDVVERLLAEAEGLERVATEAGRAAGSTVAETVGDPLTLEGARFAERALAAACSGEAWRSPRDRTRIMRRHVADAAARLSRDDLAMQSARLSRRWARDEAFYYRASLHGHSFVDPSVPLVDALRRAAVAIVVARHLGETGSFEEHPLAPVLAMVRGMGR